LSRSGYSDDYGDDDPLALGRWRAAVRSATHGRPGQAFLRELLAALDALPHKRLVANVLQEGEWDDSGEHIVPVKDGDVCAFGAVGRARGIEMPARLDLDDDDDDMAHEVQCLFGTTDALSREIMHHNDDGGIGRRVPIPNVLESRGDWFGYTYIPETPEQRFERMRKWVVAQIDRCAGCGAILNECDSTKLLRTPHRPKSRRRRWHVSCHRQAFGSAALTAASETGVGK
jgi:hypothetical protein